MLITQPLRWLKNLLGVTKLTYFTPLNPPESGGSLLLPRQRGRLGGGWLPRLFRKAKALSSRPGQSLVETAVILPILILMMLGVFEVGWALRGYLFLININREATRFASRGIYLDFSEKINPEEVGYEKVISHTLATLANNTSLDFTSGTNSNGVMIATYYTVEPRDTFHCLGDSDCLAFDCTRFGDPAHPQYVAGEDLNDIEYPILIPPLLYASDPDLPNYYNQVLTIANTTPITAYYYQIGTPFSANIDPVYSQINPEEQVIELRSKNNQLSCQLRQKNLPLSDDNVIIIENVYYQNQLVGFPIITAFVPNPVPFYSHTAMRVSTNVREQAADDESTPCQLYPMIIPSSRIQMVSGGQVITMPVSTSDPDTPGNFAFVEWRDVTLNTASLLENVASPGNADDGVFSEPDSGPPVDDDLNFGDWVRVNPGVHATAQATLLAQVGTRMKVPVWFDGTCDVGVCAADDKMRISGFEELELFAVNLTAGSPSLTFKYSAHAEPCVGDD